MKRGSLAYIYDPVRNAGSQTGFRGLAVILSVDDAGVTIRSIEPPNATFRVSKSTIQTTYPADYITEELFR